MTCLGEKNALIKNLEFEVNQGKALLLVLTDTLKNEALEQNKIARTLFSCYATMKKDYDRELFLYMENQYGRAQIAWPRQKELVELSEQNRDTLFKFYAENFSPYIIEGTYAPLYEWYPKTIDEAIKAYNDAP